MRPGVDPLHIPQRQVPILAAFVADPEPAEFADERGAIDGQMRDVVLAREQVGEEVRLEVGGMAVAVPVDLVLVAVDEIGLGPGVEQGGDLVEGVRRQRVVMVEQGDPFAGGEGERGIGGGGDVPVLSRRKTTLIRRSARGVALEQRPHVRRGRGVVGDAQLPVRIRLRQHRIDGLGQPLLRGVVDRQHDRDHRLAGETGGYWRRGPPATPACGGRRR